jgi:transcriptional regulator with XRE-family HTH domain
MSIGERIIELRKKLDMSQGDLAKAMNVSRQAVSKWENDLNSPDTIKLIQLADVLDTDVEYLATGRNTVLRRPPVVLKTVEYVDRIVERPVVRYVEKVVEKPTPVIEYIEKPIVKEVPVVKKITRTRYKRNIPEYAIVSIISLAIGILIGVLL